jgi:cytochrome c biogenesis protein CcmG, thiol:disulfide interchange protein DsbE
VATRRLPLRAFVIATPLALVAAVLVASLLDDDGSGADDRGSSGGSGGDTYQIAPAGELPASVADVTLAPLDGAADRKLGELLGSTPIVVNFFASWCAPCVTEMPAFERVHQDIGDQVQFVGIAYQNSDELAAETVERTGITYPAFGDSGQDAMSYFGGIQMPTSVFIDADGTVVDVHTGDFDDDQLRATLDDLFGVAA